MKLIISDVVIVFSIFIWIVVSDYCDLLSPSDTIGLIIGLIICIFLIEIKLEIIKINRRDRE